jgi:hypothetical protein
VNPAEILVSVVRERDRSDYWERTRSRDWPPETVFVQFVPRQAEDEHARYHPEIPRIDIYRYGCTPLHIPQCAVDMAAASPCPLDELISLAHELGHHESALRGLFCKPDDTKQEQTFEEEIRAWSFGRAILGKTQYLDWSAFEERERRALDGYREGLSLPAPRAVDIENRIRRICEALWCESPSNMALNPTVGRGRPPAG